VRISKEIQDWASGKAEGFVPEKKAKLTAALTPEQQAILQQRGHLKPEDIHRLASKVKGKVKPADDSGKASCHSDHVDDEEAKQMQGAEELVQLDVRPALGLSKEDSVI